MGKPLLLFYALVEIEFNMRFALTVLTQLATI